jgi:hypothetical protein
MDDLALVWDEVLSPVTKTWIKSPKIVTFNSSNNDVQAYHYFGYSSYFVQHKHEMTENPSLTYKCYCAAHELPKVEYSYCEGSDIQECAEDKVTNGWLPLNGVSSHHLYPGGGTLSNYQYKVQAFWRWAE